MQNVCDDCMTAAYDEGILDGEQQAQVCIDLGADIPDHLCESTDEPDIACACACHD